MSAWSAVPHNPNNVEQQQQQHPDNRSSFKIGVFESTNHTKEPHRPFTLPPLSKSRPFDILFVGCYLPKKEGKDAQLVPNKGDYMYRDVWQHSFDPPPSSSSSNPEKGNFLTRITNFMQAFAPVSSSSSKFKEENFKVHFTHQARLGKNGTEARKLVKQSRLVVFGGGGILYNSLNRRNGTAEFELIIQWHQILLETKTPYALASVGLQPVNLETIDFNKLDDGKFQLLKPFIQDAVFIASRSPSDQQLFAQWNPYSYYYPDLCFTLKKIGLTATTTQTVKPRRRNLLLTVGSVYRFETYVSELNGILKTGKYIHHHIVTSLGDLRDPLNFTTIGLLQEPKRIHFPYLQNDDLEFASAQYVYTERYHGFLMAMLNDVPYVVPVIRSWKLVTFVYHDDNKEGSSSMPELAMNHIEMIKSLFSNSSSK